MYPDASQQYNEVMYKLGIFLAIVGLSWTSMLLAAEEPPSQVPGFNERLNQALGSEGGVQVYKDPAGNVGTILDPPGWGAPHHRAATAKSVDEPRSSPSATQPTTTIASGRASYAPTLSKFSAEDSLARMIHDGSSGDLIMLILPT